MRHLHSSSSMTYYPSVAVKDPEESLRRQRRLVSDPNTDADTLHQYALDPDLFTKYKVAKHHNTSEKTLLAMVRDKEKDKKLPVLLAQNPNSTDEVLRRLITNNENNIYVWRNAAWHPNVTPGILWVLAHKDDEVTQYGVLKNPKTNDETLFFLADNSESEKIRSLARALLRKPRIVVQAPVAQAPAKTTVKPANVRNAKNISRRSVCCY